MDFVRCLPSGVGFVYDIFQFTVSNEYPLTRIGLEKLKQILPKRKRGGKTSTGVRLFSCVPFTQDSCRMPRGAGESVVIEQFVLEIRGRNHLLPQSNETQQVMVIERVE
eukprot:gb/GECG01006560.1/.p1 GENE.gb/GECG01006560.1/~~gb/GECG01006560.1/.p1  ORF type:complete len:109 (+),score=10.33 gb/GECG01006560.1/:1-327(+)